jgi:prefoldin subunit 5
MSSGCHAQKFKKEATRAPKVYFTKMADVDDEDESHQPVQSEDIIRYHRFIANSLQPSVINLEKKCQEIEYKLEGCGKFAQLLFEDTNNNSADKNSKLPQQEEVKPVIAPVSIGEHCYLDAKLHSRKYMVDAGVLGVYIEMNNEEAQEFIHVRGKLLAEKLDNAKYELENVSADLTYAQDILKQLQQIPND